MRALDRARNAPRLAIHGLHVTAPAFGRTGIEHEELYPELLARTDVGFERIEGMPWTEIDFPDDVEHAERHVLPRIEIPPPTPGG